MRWIEKIKRNLKKKILNIKHLRFQPSRLLKTWISEFLIKVNFFKPQFIGLHLQEVGGKTYEKSMEYVQEFIKILCESDELQSYDRIRVYLDEDYTSAENFTVSYFLFRQNIFTIDKSKTINFTFLSWRIYCMCSLKVNNKKAKSANLFVWSELQFSLLITFK